MARSKRGKDYNDAKMKGNPKEYGEKFCKNICGRRASTTMTHIPIVFQESLGKEGIKHAAHSFIWFRQAIQ